MSLSYSTEFRMEKQRMRSFLRELKLLVKGLVLVANVLPIISGFWIALYFTNTSFSALWDKFIIVAVGGTLVIAGALVLNNWYEVDLDREMHRKIGRASCRVRV